MSRNGWWRTGAGGRVFVTRLARAAASRPASTIARQFDGLARIRSSNRRAMGAGLRCPHSHDRTKPLADIVQHLGANPVIWLKRNATGSLVACLAKPSTTSGSTASHSLPGTTSGHTCGSTVANRQELFRNANRSKTDVAAKNEVLAKVLCHNILLPYQCVFTSLGLSRCSGWMAAQKPKHLHNNQTDWRGLCAKLTFGDFWGH